MVGLSQFRAESPPELAPSPTADSRSPEAGIDARLDDRTVAYVLKMRSCFDSLRQVAAQLAGVLVLASTGGRSQMLDLPMLEVAADEQRRAEIALRAAAVPAAAAHHHFHLSRAAEWIGEALRLALGGTLRSDDATLDATFGKLRLGWQEIHAAAGALPGFQVVDFSQACCAVHANGKAATGIR